MGGLAWYKSTHYSRVCQATPYDHDVENPLADIDDVTSIDDPAERAREIGRRLNAIPAWNARLRQMRQDAIQQMRGQGMSWAEIGREIGMHRNRVQQIGEGRSGGGQGGSREDAD